MASKRRVLVVGIDGASPEIIYSLCSKGKMPSLSRLVENGTRARLRSTIPAHSGPAWISAITGKNPGKHGVFFFTTVNPRRSEPRIVSSRDIRTDTIFDLVGAKGLKSIALNVPLTYPPWRINGVLVSGMFAPSEISNFTSPPEVGPELAGKGYKVEFASWDDYEVAKRSARSAKDVGSLVKYRQSYFEHVMNLDDRNVEALLHLFSSHEWDFSMVVLPGLDRIQHILWKPISDSERDPEGADFGCGRHIVEAYKRVDSLIGRVLAQVGEETWVLVISDHGFGLTPRIFYVNRWLKQKGLLVPRAKKKSFSKLFGTKAKADSGGSSSSGSENQGGRTADSLSFHGLLPLGQIDLSRTRAYAPTPYGLVNMADDAPAGLKSALASAFEGLIDPKLGSKIIEKAHLTSQLYEGPFQPEASDILLEPNTNYYIANAIDEGDFVTDAPRYPASHKPDGILLISGPEVKKGYELPKAHILDVTPTVLRLLGLSLPSSVDGTPLDGAFWPDGQLLSEEITYHEVREVKTDISARIGELKEKGRL